MGREEKKTTLDNILLVLGAFLFYSKPIEGRTRLQKIVYLLENKYRLPLGFDFKPYYYGPYSEELSDLVSLLSALSFVEEKASYFGIGRVRYDYVLTEKGRKYFDEFSEASEKGTKQTIKRLKGYISELSTLPTFELISEAKTLMRKSETSQACS